MASAFFPVGLIILIVAADTISGAAAFDGPGTVVAFSKGKTVSVIERLKEASGLAMSRLHKDVLYAHEDDGDAALYAINSTNGQVLSKIKVSGATNNDWEDIAVGPCGQDSCIYIADTGDKNANSAVNIIYRVKESLTMSSLSVDAKASFKWEYEDAETLMVDPSGSVWLIPKVKDDPKVFKIETSRFGGKKANLTGRGSAIDIDLGGKFGPTSGDISSDGTEILIRTKDGVWHYQLQGEDDTVRLALARTPTKLPVKDEPQGEALCWSATADGYYTLSEGLRQPLYYYKRIKLPSNPLVG